ncbi:something about silencing protein 10 [Phymastichus coffea]|uniref:something about silencing protein 10 n=1 Tax=Phymastichus coffea TaxID=108790 RepID=UPI00273BCBD4|nr:something about silencing protein 10 [Phymastichus coffea]
MSKRNRVADNEVSDEEMEDIDMNAMVDSEEELSDGERKLLEKIRQKRQKRNYDSEDEVMGFEDEDADEDEDERDSMASDIEGLEEKFDLPNEKAWGKRKQAYYSADYVDPDYTSVSQKDIADAEMEEQEARNLQKRIAEQLDEADFGLDLVISRKDDTDFDKDGEHIKTDLSKLSKRQKQELLEKESPEFVPLVTDFSERLTEMKTILGPFLNLVENSNCPDCFATNFIRKKYDLLLHYCINISFYLMLKSKRESVASHPVIKRLAQYRQLLSQFEECQGDLLDKVQLILEANKNGESLYSSVETNTVNKTIKNIELEVSGSKKYKKKVVFEDFNSDEDYEEIPKSDFNHLEYDEENKETKNDLEKRGITYQIAKNRGLTPHRKKEQRNPRVKHRNKYRKAIIRRKGAIRPVRKEITKYDGEISGIKASVKKSIKLK